MDKSFLDYTHWQATADTLHMYLQIAGKVKLERSYPEPEWGHVRMPLTVQGIGTGLIPAENSNFEIYFNLRQHHVDVQNTNYIRTRIDLEDGLSVADFYRQLTGALEFIGSPTAITTMPQEFYDPEPFDQDTRHHSYSKNAVELFLDNLQFAHRSLTRFLAPMRGKMFLPAYWFGTMDLSGMLFSGERLPFQGAGEGAGQIEVNTFDERFCEFGFWPGDPSTPQPAFYVLPYPFLADVGGSEGLLAPDKARFEVQQNEFLLTLEDALSYPDPGQAVVDFCRSSFDLLQRLDRWQHLEWITEPLTYARRADSWTSDS